MTPDNLLSYLGASLTVAAAYAMGSKRYKLGFILAMLNDPIWVYLGFWRTGLHGMAILSMITCLMNVRGLWKLHKNT